MRPRLGGEQARLTALYSGLLMLSGVLLTTVVHLLVKLGSEDSGDLGVGLVIEVAQNDCHALLGRQCGQESVDFVALDQLFA